MVLVQKPLLIPIINSGSSTTSDSSYKLLQMNLSVVVVDCETKSSTERNKRAGRLPHP
jgi:hypothetical protein